MWNHGAQISCSRALGGTGPSVAALEIAVTAIETTNRVMSDARYTIAKQLDGFYRRDPSWFLTEPKVDDR